MLVRWTGQDYIDGEAFETEFFVTILPKPAADQFNSPKPFFVLNGYEAVYNILVGEGWSLELPLGRHPTEDLYVTYSKVDLGSAARFITHDKLNDSI